MTISVKTEGSKAVIELEGWLDTETAPQLGEAIKELPEKIEKLELDFSELEYISSAGIRQLVAAHKAMKGNLELSHVSDEVLEVLKMTGVTKKLTITQD